MEPPQQVVDLRIGDCIRVQGQVGLWRLDSLEQRPGATRARFKLVGGGSLTISSGAWLRMQLGDSVTVATHGSGQSVADLMEPEQVRVIRLQAERGGASL